MEIAFALRGNLLRVFASCCITAAASTSLGQNPSGQTAAQNQTKTSSATQPAPQRPPRVISDLSQFHLDQMPKSKQPQLGAGSRGAGSNIVLCAPASGEAASARPLFQWTGSDAGSKVTFSLLNDNGDVLYENDVTGTSLEYPADAPALQPGQTYSWKVSGGEMNRLPDPVSFKLQSTQESSALQAALASTSDPLARAQVYLKLGLWYDTVAALQTAIQAHPDRSDLREQLSLLNQQVAPACVTP